MALPLARWDHLEKVLNLQVVRLVLLTKLRVPIKEYRKTALRKQIDNTSPAVQFFIINEYCLIIKKLQIKPPHLSSVFVDKFTFSRNARPGLKWILTLAGILTLSPDLGFRPCFAGQ